MARKRKLSLNDLGSISVTPVNRIEGHITNLRDFQKQYDADEKAKAEAPARKIVAESQAKVSAVLAEHSARVAKFWRLPIASIEDYLKYDDEVVDDRLDLPTTETPLTNEEFTTALKTFVESLPSRGVELLTQESRRRFALYACSQRDSRHAAIDDNTLTAMLERCLALKIFGSEVTGELARANQAREKQAPVQPKAPTFDDISGLNPNDRDQRRQIVNVLGDNFTTEVADFFNRWLAQLRKDYNYVMPEVVIKRALQYVTDANKNPLSYKTWDDIRVLFTRNGWMLTPDGQQMLTPRESLAAYCDTHDLNDREVRSYIARRNMEIHESERPYAPHR